MGTRVTVGQLAAEARMDLDEALLRIWDSGLAYILDPATAIRHGDLNRARRAIGIPTRRELTSHLYWQEVLHLDEAELAALFDRLQIVRRPGTSRLPKGSVAKLKAELRRRDLSLATETKRPPTTPMVPEPFQFIQVGRLASPRVLSTSDVMRIHEALASDFAFAEDPIEPAGVRSPSLLDSAVHRPQTSLGDQAKYETIEMASAALLHALVHNHPFHNGNKRTALVSLLVMLDENSMMLTCDEDELFRFVLHVAQHRLVEATDRLADREVLAIAEWIWTNSRMLERGERSLPFRRLRQILTRYGCVFEFPNGVGNRINIYRSIRRARQGLSKLFGSTKIVTLKTQIAYRNEGADVQKNTVSKIRYDLKLDEDHGVDSSAFYDEAAVSAGAFISRYRTTLRRLARV